MIPCPPPSSMCYNSLHSSWELVLSTPSGAVYKRQNTYDSLSLSLTQTHAQYYLAISLTWPEVFMSRTRSSMRFGHCAGKSTLLMIVRASANWKTTQTMQESPGNDPHVGKHKNIHERGMLSVMHHTGTSHRQRDKRRRQETTQEDRKTL